MPAVILCLRSDPVMTTSASESGLFSSQTARFSVPPFAGPTSGAASALMAPVTRWDTGPFVPAPWRLAMSARLVATPALPSAAVTPATPTPVGAIAATPSPVMPVASVATPGESVPALFGHVTDEHPLPSIREFLSADAPARAASPYAEAIEAASADTAAEAVAEAAADTAATTPAETSTDASGDLPWIDQFLANTPVAPMDAIAGPPDVYRYSTPVSSPVIAPEADALAEDHALDTSSATTIDASNVADVASLDASPDASPEPLAQPTPLYTTPVSLTPVASRTPLRVDAVPPYVPADADAGGAAFDTASDAASNTASDATAAEEWPLAETAEALDELSRELIDGSADSLDSPARLFGEMAPPAPLPAWSDDDLLNIMPTSPVASMGLTTTHATPVQALFAEDSAPEEAAADASAIAAAQALEVLARRVRNGELQLPGYDPRMGDAAALVSALAALLGIRLG